MTGEEVLRYHPRGKPIPYGWKVVDDFSGCHHGAYAVLIKRVSPGMKGLSIRQPWLFCILECGKRVENRTWYSDYRGPVLLHASKGMTLREYYDFYNAVMGGGAPYAGEVLRGRTGLPEVDALPRGGFVGVAEVVDCVSESDSPWFFGPFGFVLENVRPIPFVAARGRLGFFDADYEA